MIQHPYIRSGLLFFRGVVGALVLVAGSGGCAALARRSGARLMAPAADQLARSLERQDDLELVRDGAPSFLLLLDALAQRPEARPNVQVAAAEAYTAYALTFVDDENRPRSRRMLKRARDYGLLALANTRAFREAQHAPLPEFEAALERFSEADVPALFITAQAWSSWILASPGSVFALAEFPRALALMKRVAELNPGYRQGGPDLFFGVYYTVQPLGAGRDLDRAAEHFDRALRQAGDGVFLPRVLYAETFARYTLDRELFETMLREVLDHPGGDPDAALMNAAARERAAALWEQADELF